MGGGGGKVKETEYDKEVAAIAKERYARYKSDFIPAENFLIDKATDEQSLEQRGLNKASVDYGARFDDGQANVTQANNARGAAPGSGAFNAGAEGYGRDRAQATAAGLTDTRNRVKDAVASNEVNLVSYGMGQASDSLQGQIDVAATADRQAVLDAQAAQAARAGIGYTVGAAAGYGLGAIGTPSAAPVAPQPTSSFAPGYTPTMNNMNYASNGLLNKPPG